MEMPFITLEGLLLGHGTAATLVCHF